MYCISEKDIPDNYLFLLIQLPRITIFTKSLLTHTARVNIPLFGPRYLNPCKQVSPKKLEMPSNKGDKNMIPNLIAAH